MRTAEQLFKDLVNLTADRWNAKLSEELGMSVDVFRTSIINKEQLTNNEDKITLGLRKSAITNEFYKSDDSGSDFTPKTITKYVLRINEGTAYSDAIACTGKYLVGMDFRGAELSDSYFCDCVFFNCDLSHADLCCVNFSGCIFNNCTFANSDISASVFTKGKIIDCVFDNASCQYLVIHDTIIIASQFMFADFSQSTITASGMIQCIAGSMCFKDARFLHFSTSMSDFTGGDFRGVNLVDCVFTDSDFRSCNFAKYSATCVTASRIECDSDFECVFDMSHALYSPSVFEWDIEDESERHDDDDLEETMD